MLIEALVHIEHIGERVAHAEMLRLKGKLPLLMSGGAATAEAEEYFRAALAVARAQNQMVGTADCREPRTPAA